ncbi:MAG: hypothetical protein JWL80_418 [Parcubacteria group bacterium]|nr:hypothetical protein [Parcubacteria group bacterium]
MSQNANVVVSAIDFFELEFGGLPEEKQVQIEDYLRIFMKRYRRIIEPDAPEDTACTTSGPRCGSCAFNPSLDSSKDFRSTAYGVLRSVREGLPFICHRNQREWKDGKIDKDHLLICKGFQVGIQNDVDEVIKLSIATLLLITIATGRTTP